MPRVRRCSRASSRLAPSVISTRPCDLPEQKTRDASNRLLPPERLACTRTSRVPGSLPQLSPRGCPAESWAPRSMTGGLDVSRRPFPLRRIVSNALASCLRPYGLRAHERGRCLPTALDSIEPLTPLSPLPLATRRCSPSRARRSRFLSVARAGWSGEGAAKTTSTPPRERRRLQ